MSTIVNDKRARELVDAAARVRARDLYKGEEAEFLQSRPVSTLLATEGAERRAAVRAMAAAMGEFGKRIASGKDVDPWDGARWVNLHEWHRWMRLLGRLIGRGGSLVESDWAAVFRGLSAFKQIHVFDHDYVRGIVSAFVKFANGHETGPTVRRYALKVANSLASGANAAERRLARELEACMGQKSSLAIAAGEGWSDQAIQDISKVTSGRQRIWSAVFYLCARATSANPSRSWQKAAAAAMADIPLPEFRDRFVRWVGLLDASRTEALEADWRWRGRSDAYIAEGNQTVLRGLCWLASEYSDPAIARALSKAALSCYRKVPGIGPRAVKVGNGAVTALGMMPGRDALGQLAFLRVKVKFGSAQIVIEKALSAAAAREGLPRDEIEELAVPAYGMTEVGRRSEELAKHRIDVVVVGIGDVELRYFKPDGKPIKAVPAALKAECAEELKELKAAAKDAAAMLSAQRDRIDGLFVHNQTWPVSIWRERYLDHPLVGVIARRLIWQIEGAGNNRAATWLDSTNALVDVNGKEVAVPENARVGLWHPIGQSVDDVMAWRRFFEDRQIKQPFKQAHREVYLLTDAERNTRTYSNRFAAHIIRQHQFNALCGLRGWKNKLRLMVDAEYPPASRELAAYGLRAEFWIEGVGGEHGTDTNDAGVFNLLATDQVRFYAIEANQAMAHAGGGGYGAAWGRGDVAEGVPLERIPELVLSEILRDVDLFVGVASVGNNPAWNDGGPAGTHRDYWWEYSFGDLAEVGKNRRDILARLLPRLNIAAACELGDKFLTVRGKLRTYKIHLGSGNILMEPNDQYLCIVPSSKDERGTSTSGVFLPFEGDRTLSIILSKAFMLAEDDKIQDTSITRQIKGA